MAHRLKTPEGKKLYALRKCMPEPVFGIIKSVLGFRQFLLRGLQNVRGEWSLVTMAWNLDVRSESRLRGRFSLPIEHVDGFERCFQPLNSAEGAFGYEGWKRMRGRLRNLL